MILRLREKFPDRVMEWQSAAILISWGAVLAQPGNTLGSSPSYSVIHGVVSEPYLSLIMTIAGLIWLAGLYINGTVPSVTPWVRVGCASIGLLIWILIALGFLLANNLSTAVAVYPWFAAGCAFSVYRAAADS